MEALNIRPRGDYIVNLADKRELKGLKDEEYLILEKMKVELLSALQQKEIELNRSDFFNTIQIEQNKTGSIHDRWGMLFDDILHSIDKGEENPPYTIIEDNLGNGRREKDKTTLEIVLNREFPAPSLANEIDLNNDLI